MRDVQKACCNVDKEDTLRPMKQSKQIEEKVTVRNETRQMTCSTRSSSPDVNEKRWGGQGKACATVRVREGSVAYNQPSVECWIVEGVESRTITSRDV